MVGPRYIENDLENFSILLKNWSLEIVNNPLTIFK